MRYILIFMCSFALQNAWAEMTLTILDQDNMPVQDAVVIVANSSVVTPDTVAIMDQIDESFVPRVLVVQKGQSVAFPNSDDIRHHVYSFSKPKVFEIKLYKGTEIDPILFDKPGLIVLGCNIHDDMIGYIIVADNTFSVKTDKEGKARLPVKQGDTVSLWSERMLDGVSATLDLEITDDSQQTVALELLPPIEPMGSMYSGFGKSKWSK